VSAIENDEEGQRYWKYRSVGSRSWAYHSLHLTVRLICFQIAFW